MRSSITQKAPYGCGVAAFAFVAGISYREAATILDVNGCTKAQGVYVRDLAKALTNFGLPSEYRYVKPHLLDRLNEEGTIVWVVNPGAYDGGHYLVRHASRWMDPWINLDVDPDIRRAASGYRQDLPGRPVFAVFPLEIT